MNPGSHPTEKRTLKQILERCCIVHSICNLSVLAIHCRDRQTYEELEEIENTVALARQCDRKNIQRISFFLKKEELVTIPTSHFLEPCWD